MLTIAETLELAAGESYVRVTFKNGRVAIGSVRLCNYRFVDGKGWAHQGEFDSITLTRKSGSSARVAVASMATVELV